MSDGLSDVGCALRYPQDAEGEVPQRGHRARTCAGADLGAVLVVGHVPRPVQAVLDRPVAADPAGEFGWGGLVGGEAGDGIHRFGGPFLTVEPAGLAGDLDGLAGVREDDPGLHRYGLDDALLHPAMSTISGGMCRWDVFPRQCLELVVQARLVGFNGEQVVRTALEHQIVGVISLRV